MKYNLNHETSFPCWGLPSIAQDLVSEVSRAKQCSEAAVVAPAIVAFSTAIGSGVTVHLGSYSNKLALFAGLVGDSSTNKSEPAKSCVFPPLTRIHARMIAEYERKKEIQRMAETESKSKRKTPITDMVKPIQLYLYDATPEARNEALKHNPRGVIWYREELAGLFQDFGRYNKSGEESVLLQIYNNDPITINRKGEGVTYIESPWACIYGSIQPKVFRSIFKDSISLDNGLLPRFVWFDVDHRQRDYSLCEVVDPEKQEQWDNLLTIMYDHDWSGQHPAPTIAQGVRELYDSFRNDTTYSRGYEASVCGKLHIAVPKLAGIAAAARLAQNGFEDPFEISRDDMLWAIQCAYYFRRTALQVERLCRGWNNDEDRSEEPKEDLSKGSAFKFLLDLYPKARKTKIAEAFGIARPTLDKYLKQ